MSYNLGNVKGPAGKGIQSITKTGTSGLIDTYTITYSDGTTSSFTVTNGSSGADIVTTWETTLSNDKVPSEKLTKDTLDTKASNSHTHGNLSNDGKIGSTTGKIIVTGTGGLLGASDLKTINNNSLLGSGNIDIQGSSVDIDTSFPSTPSDTHVPSTKLVKNSLDGKASSSHNHSISDVTNLQTSLNAKANSSDLGAVATSNDYDDLDNIPSSFTPSAHTHDDRYYTETETDTLLNAKADASHTHQKSDISDFSHTHSISDVSNLQSSLDSKVNTSDIANNLTTTTEGKVLDARQGKALADLIGDAIDYINL